MFSEAIPVFQMPSPKTFANLAPMRTLRRSAHLFGPKTNMPSDRQQEEDVLIILGGETADCPGHTRALRSIWGLEKCQALSIQMSSGGPPCWKKDH